MKKLDKISIVLGLTFVLFFSGYVISGNAAYADTPLVAVGDVGCKTNAKTNLDNIGDRPDTDGNFLGLGDYLYSCSTSSVQSLWDHITQEKHGVVGNHDNEKSSTMKWMRDNLGLGLNGWFSWKINDIVIIGINTYKPFNAGSPQNDYLKQKTTQFCGRDDSMLSPINWVIYAMHEPIQTPNVGGGHGPNTALRNVIEPLAESCGNNVLILEAHNHITAFGNVQGNNHALCGGGGFGGDSTGNSNGFEFQTQKSGYCRFNFSDNVIEASLIAPDGRVIGSHTFTQ